MRLTEPYYIGKYELTQGQWEEIMGTRPWVGKRNVEVAANHPACYIAWADLTKLVDLFDEATPGWAIRLPTEAEWERACRAGAYEAFCFGRDAARLPDYAWFNVTVPAGEASHGARVGLKHPNAWGLYDMHGNVWEWCRDWFSWYSYDEQTNPQGPAAGRLRAQRGGSYSAPAGRCTSSYRLGNGPLRRHAELGARLVLARQGAAGTLASRSAIGQPLGSAGFFVVPSEDRDQYGNPVVTRAGSRTDAVTGLPYEVWLKEPRIEFVLIPAGEFLMGSTQATRELLRAYGGHARLTPRERPQHRVRIARPFYLGKYEVTEAQWRRVMGKHPWRSSREVHRGDHFPAVTLTWQDARVFAVKLQDLAGGRGTRLPTESEWEYACRAGTTTAYSFGDDRARLGEYAWYKENASDKGEKFAHRVGRKKPNPWGLYDMHGNARELCADALRTYSERAHTDPRGPKLGLPADRGGSYLNDAGWCRSAHRGIGKSEAIYAFRGLRVALSVP